MSRSERIFQRERGGEGAFEFFGAEFQSLDKLERPKLASRSRCSAPSSLFPSFLPSRHLGVTWELLLLMRCTSNLFSRCTSGTQWGRADGRRFYFQRSFRRRGYELLM